MEEDIDNKKIIENIYIEFKNNKTKHKEIKIYIFIIFIILLSIFLFLILKIIKLNFQLKKLKKFNYIKIFQYNQKNQLRKNNNIRNSNEFENNLLQLYIENRTQYYIKGRQKHMKSIGKYYNESNIITIQDKLNWLLIHDSPESKADIVDKVLLRNYSKKILGKDICVPIIKIYKDINEINLEELPNKFVLKCNHGSGMNILCNNKSSFDINKAKNQLRYWMTINYGLKYHEYQYINVKKKIFAEYFLKENLTDYKFYCFNGLPKIIKVQSKYYKKNLKMYHYYDINWKITDIETKLNGNIKLPQIKFQKPKHFNLMIEYAKKFSENFTFVRVDLYEFNDTVYLSELTFSPANVRSPYRDEKQRIYLGSLLNLSKVNNSYLNKNI